MKPMPLIDIVELADAFDATNPEDSLWLEFARAVEKHHGIGAAPAHPAGDAIRDAALEEAAKACEDMLRSGDSSHIASYEDNHAEGHVDGCNNCAAAIRALRGRTP